jgi:hypothetical protein
VANVRKGPTDPNKATWIVRRIGDQDQWRVPFGDEPFAWVEVVSDDPRWQDYWFRVTFDDGHVSSFMVNRAGGAEALTARKLSDVPYGAIEQCARQRVQSWLGEYTAGRPEAAVLASTELEDVLSQVRYPRSDVPSEREAMLARLAYRYSETLGEPYQAIELADEFGFSDSHIPNLVKEARKRGILSPTTKGRAGGAPTARAKKILEATEEPVEDVAVPQHPRMAEAIEANQRMKEALEAGDMKEWNRLVDEANKEAGHG